MGRLISNTDTVAQFDWPEDCHIQGGSRGLVFTGDGDYWTAFFEAFPPDTFIRGEGTTLAEAEEAAWAKYQKILACPHPSFEARAYRNGSGFCTGCGQWFPSEITGLPQLPAEDDPRPLGLLVRLMDRDPAALRELLDRAETAAPQRPRP